MHFEKHLKNWAAGNCEQIENCAPQEIRKARLNPPPHLISQCSFAYSGTVRRLPVFCRVKFIGMPRRLH